MDKIMITNSIYGSTWSPICRDCSIIPQAGEIYEVDKGIVLCPYCGFKFDKANSYHIIMHSKPWEVMAEPKQKDLRDDTIDALKTVITAIEQAQAIDYGTFNCDAETEISDDYTVWKKKIPTGWHRLTIDLRYKTRNSGETK